MMLNLTQPFVKIIAGITQTEWDAVASTIEAAERANAPALDVAAAGDIVSRARGVYSGTLFASSVEPEALLVAAQQGADVLELGNYDALYATGDFFTAEDVLRLTRRTLSLLAADNRKVPVCVTIPGHLDKASQQQLAMDLADMGVAMLQTEGTARMLSTTPGVAILSAEQQAALTLANARAIMNATSLPVMAASGITEANLSSMLEAGVAAVGVGRSVRNAGDIDSQIQAITVLMAACKQVPAAAVSVA